jgi:hypothetical protein
MIIDSAVVNRLELENRIRMGQYLSLEELFQLIGNHEPLLKILQDHKDRIFSAPGSSHNHQAWEGGYVHHITECMNIAAQIFWCLDDLRPLPFLLSDVLVVMFLHDLEKPWKLDIPLRTKADRRDFRERMIADYGISLTDEQRNALRYVEGVPDSEYTPGERTMNELAAFCHMVDIASARLWHDKGREGKW